ncbi:MAG: glutamine--fructose-6-phosphate transaminase (isomerizing) [Thermodesulfobacteriota bacterium]|nr:glutamine--fructose-6-phosphate transaminase (isomerizing) [Thermodesulfobacteriota bacterium]
MCGIVGYIGKRECLPIIIEGLKKLEYRGYDSAGIAIIHESNICIRRSKGKIKNLESLISDKKIDGCVGIGHTRWATHGKPSDENAHPHRAGDITVVHNGIIENYQGLKGLLEGEGRNFRSETDTEIISHLADKFFQETGNAEIALRMTLEKLEGAYAIGMLCEKDGDTLFAARRESPLIIGIGCDEYFIASDVPAILNHTRDVVFLDDYEYAVLKKGSYEIKKLDGTPVKKATKKILWDPVMAEKGGYKHFMLKEIHEQPRAIIDTIRSKVHDISLENLFDEINVKDFKLDRVKRIGIIACGTSYHAGLVGKFILEKICRMPVEVDLGSEFRYRDPVVDKETLLLFISQSGETADTIGALKEGKKRKARIISICNVIGSTLARESHGVIYTHAGPELSVASTKAFTTQLSILYLFGILMGTIRKTLGDKEVIHYTESLVKLPSKIEEILNFEKKIEAIAKQYATYSDFLYLGRGIIYPVALEGALKLKEISYIHAEGYPAGEMKHGPIALIDENMPIVVLISKGNGYTKILSNIEEVKARGGKVIGVANNITKDLEKKLDQVIPIPETEPLFSPILFTIPLQLLAYSIAVLRGTDVDQPRNLAKSVTVE